MDTQLVSTILRVNGLIDELISSQEAQQRMIGEILTALQEYQKNMDELYERLYGKPVR